MQTISWILFGVLIGFFIHLFENREKSSLSSILVLGALGGLTGGLTASFVFGITIQAVSLLSFSIAAGSAIILLFCVKSILQHRKSIKRRGYA